MRRFILLRAAFVLARSPPEYLCDDVLLSDLCPDRAADERADRRSVDRPDAVAVNFADGLADTFADHRTDPVAKYIADSLAVRQADNVNSDGFSECASNKEPLPDSNNVRPDNRPDIRPNRVSDLL